MFYWSFTSLVHFWFHPIFNPGYACVVACETLREYQLTWSGNKYSRWISVSNLSGNSSGCSEKEDEEETEDEEATRGKKSGRGRHRAAAKDRSDGTFRI